MKKKYQKIKQIVEEKLACSSHTMAHVRRVYRLCLQLAEHVSAVDMDILKPAALLHDIARAQEDKDATAEIDHAMLGSKMAAGILEDLGYAQDKIEAITHCIATHRFRSEKEPKTKEAKVLFDADKLDVIGATGIARSFMIAGGYNQQMYADVDVEEYMADNLVGGEPNGRIMELSKHAPNLEFETKLKRIPDQLHTAKAKEIGEQRIAFMQRFFERLKKERGGKL